MSTEATTGRFRRALKKLSATPDEMEADEIGEAREKVGGCQRIEKLNDRERVTVFGHVKHVTLAPRAGTPTLEAALYDGSGVVTLVWLGVAKLAMGWPLQLAALATMAWMLGRDQTPITIPHKQEEPATFSSGGN